jgi:hypothetical protein
LSGSNGPVDQRDERHPSKIDKDGRRHYLIRAIPYQDAQQEAERLKAVHEARVKIVPGVPIGLVYLSGGVILGLAFVALGAWWLRSGNARDIRDTRESTVTG